MNRGGIFLDRDGTINTEVDYLSTPDQLELIPRSADAIREANGLGFKVFIITNQSGIARGILTEQQLSLVHDELNRRLTELDAHIDAFYFCPHHPDYGAAEYKKDCDCRKPNTGMIRQAAKEFNIDLQQSFVIGDRINDIQTGNNAGIPSILVLTGYGKKERTMFPESAADIDYVADDLYDAIQYVKRTIHAESTSH